MYYEKKEDRVKYMALPHLARPNTFHFHNEVEIIINMGRGADANAFIDAKKYHLEKEWDAVLVTPGQIHSYETLSNGLFMAFIFPAEHIPRLQKVLLTMQPAESMFNLKDIGAHDIILNFWKMSDCFRTDEKHARSTIIIGYMNILMAHIYYKLDFRKIEDDTSLVKKIVLYLTENYTEHITLTDLSETFKTPRPVISKIFNSATGITVPSFLNWVRITAAAEKLISTSDSITDISSSVGFYTIRNFNRTFIDFYGMTPSQYRAKNK